MIKPETIKKLEAKYHVHIDHEKDYKRWPYDGWYDVFRLYSKDGCHWSTVIGYRSLIKELAESKDALRRLAGLNELIEKGY